MLASAGYWGNLAQNVVSAAALIFGGVWGYYKFVRGRTFHRRAEIDVTGAVVSRSPVVVRGKVTLTNTGSANIRLRAAKLRVSKFQPGHTDEQTGYKDWSWLGSGDLFEDHEWVESQETIADDVLIQLDDEVPRDCPLRLSVVVLPKPKRKLYAPWKTKGTGWFGQCVIPVEPDMTEGERSARPRSPNSTQRRRGGSEEDREGGQ